MLKLKKHENRMIHLIAILYIATIGFNMLSRTDNFHYGFLANIRYIYIVVQVLYLFSTCHGVIPGRPFIVMFFLLLHTVLFGLVYTNENVQSLIIVHFKEMIIYILIIFLTCYFVWSQDLFQDFMQWNFWTTAFVLLRAGITHRSHFVNPLYFIYVFSSTHSYRTTFGFGHANFTGNMCLFTLAYSVFFLEELRRKKHISHMLRNNYVRLILFTDIILGEMLFSTQSRTSILAGVIFIVSYIFYNWKDVFRFSYRARAIFTYIAVVLIIAFIVTGGPAGIWADAHRDGNITVNYPIFKTFSPWTGMGYIPPYGFYTNAYGLGTFALDIYYVYIFFTTGYLGSAIIILFLITVFTFILFIRDRQKKVITITLFVAILITGLGQTNMIVYTLLPSMINWTVICLEICPELAGE